jgi:hypothetical protein
MTMVLLIATGCYCRSGGMRPTIVSEEKNELFHDPYKRFGIMVPGNAELKSVDSPESNMYEFGIKDDEGVIGMIVRVTVFEKKTEQEADVFDSSYEGRFLSTCRCGIIERGVINFDGKPARHYTVSLRNGEWIGYQRHFRRNSRIFIIGASGPVGTAGAVQEMHARLLESFQVLVKE